MPTLKTRTYRGYASQVAEACKWLAELDIPYEATRIGSYERLWNRLADCVERGRPEEFFDAVPFPEFSNAAFESTELITIHAGLCGKLRDGLVERLKASLKGQILFKDDIENRTGRDFAFELFVAALFSTRGYGIDLNKEADLEVCFEGRRLLVECKRLKSERKIEARVKDALKQLEKRYAASPDCQTVDGIVALSLSKLLNPSLGLIQARTVSKASEYVGLHIDRFVKDHGKRWLGRPEGRHLGVLLSLSSPVEITRRNLFLTSQEIAVSNICKQGTVGFERLLRLAATLSDEA